MGVVRLPPVRFDSSCPAKVPAENPEEYACDIASGLPFFRRF